MVDQEYRIAHDYKVDPDDLTLHMGDWRNYPWGIRGLVESQPAYQMLYSDDWHPILFENVEASSNQVTVTVREDANWSTGEPITGQDVVNSVLLSLVRRLDTSPDELQSIEDIGNPLNAVTAPTDGGHWRDDALIADGKKAVFKTKNGWWGENAKWRQRFIEHEFWKANPLEPGVHDGIIDGIMELDEPFGADSERLTELTTQYAKGEGPAYGGDLGWKDYPTNGPFKLKEVNGPNFVLERHEGHPFSDYINWPTIVAEYMEGGKATRTALVNGHLDGASNVSMPTRTLESLPSNVKEFRHETPGGTTLLINCDRETFGDVRVRQALQYVIDREALTNAVSGETVVEASPVEIPGAMGGLQERLDDEFIQQLNTYPTDTSKAAELLREAGFSKQGGTWHKPNGEAWEFKFQTTASVPYLETLVVDQLKRFGINAELYTQDDAVFEDNKKNGKHAMIKDGWGGELDSVHHFFWWQPQNPPVRNTYGLFSDEEVENWVEAHDHINMDDNGYTHNFTIEDLKGWFTLEAPPVGEPDGELQEYDVAWAALALNYEYKVEGYSWEDLAKMLTWVYNWHVPAQIPVNKHMGQKFHNTEDWLVPSEDEEKQWYRGIDSLMTTGRISAKPEDY